jgi:PadR family transcriptional regulator, regulatory protein AphA
MKLTSTSYVVLGMLRLGQRNGYEIKQLVDRTVRFFWAISYGQLYPELRRLEEAGYVTSADDPQGGRQRRAYTLTPEGEDVLVEWLRQDSADDTQELRDEGLLKLFFIDAINPADAAAIAGSAADRHRRMIATLEAVERDFHPTARGPRAVLDFGLDYHRWCAERFARMQKELEE